QRHGRVRLVTCGKVEEQIADRANVEPCVQPRPYGADAFEFLDRGAESDSGRRWRDPAWRLRRRWRRSAKRSLVGSRQKGMSLFKARFAVLRRQGRVFAQQIDHSSDIFRIKGG